ncbi:hypothetical protein PUN28_006517 [Cardiocondyla obscurior]|uniref:Uncharacterized protein n=1 Tax=Cardiocondyla obscurior TaxID=286306 RepID=A0AAW2GDT5_9HYME
MQMRFTPLRKHELTTSLPAGYGVEAGRLQLKKTTLLGKILQSAKSCRPQTATLFRARGISLRARSYPFTLELLLLIPTTFIIYISIVNYSVLSMRIYFVRFTFSLQFYEIYAIGKCKLRARHRRSIVRAARYLTKNCDQTD